MGPANSTAGMNSIVVDHNDSVSTSTLCMVIMNVTTSIHVLGYEVASTFFTIRKDNVDGIHSWCCHFDHY